MANITKQKRDLMLSYIKKLKEQHTDDESIIALNEIENHLTEKKFGLVFEEHNEQADEMLVDNIPVFVSDGERRICKDENAPWNFIIEGDNLHALHLLEKTHKHRIDCIYIDPPYNSRAHDWKYNNDYVDPEDEYKHSKWLSMMKERLLIAKKLLNPQDSVLICTIDEKEFLHIGCLLEELFVGNRIQMISSVINPNGAYRDNQFGRTDEYLFIVQIGKSAVGPLQLIDEWKTAISEKKTNVVGDWRTLRRRGSDNIRRKSPGCFYPIYVDKTSRKILRIGASLALEDDRHSIVGNDNEYVVFPMNPNDVEGRWQLGPEEFLKRLEKGYVKVGRNNEYGPVINYLAEGEIDKIEKNIYVIDGYNDDGSVILALNEDKIPFVPGTQWRISSHNARQYGTILLDKMIGKRFKYPKSVYAVHDVLRFFLQDKKNATILDFFAGSCTTFHAVALLNAVDNGTRKSIMVTNNEISYEEEVDLTNRGFKKGDPEWESLGIANYVAWPRIKACITGYDVNGNKLSGDYGLELERYVKYEGETYTKNGKVSNKKYYVKKQVQMYPELNNVKLEDGFNCNAKYFKCEWIERKPTDYLLSNALSLHIKEMIELQNHIEVDNSRYILLLTREDFKNYVLNNANSEQIKNIWVNQNIIFNLEEIKLLKKYRFKYIPKEFFGQELKEVAE